MLSSVLRSERAVEVNIEIMRAFVRLREMVAGHADLVQRLGDLEKRYDKQFRRVFEAIRAAGAGRKNATVVAETPRWRVSGWTGFSPGAATFTP
ncbi:MAG: hypothetical protein JSW71_23070 [Gemmatimonadota bacterium]|nr:MAG: hypothetical protein JSW71_23070 [Gemmatimonadota bacterium]